MQQRRMSNYSKELFPCIGLSNRDDKVSLIGCNYLSLRGTPARVLFDEVLMALAFLLKRQNKCEYLNDPRLVRRIHEHWNRWSHGRWVSQMTRAGGRLLMDTSYVYTCVCCCGEQYSVLRQALFSCPSFAVFFHLFLFVILTANRYSGVQASGISELRMYRAGRRRSCTHYFW